LTMGQRRVRNDTLCQLMTGVEHSPMAPGNTFGHLTPPQVVISEDRLARLDNITFHGAPQRPAPKQKHAQNVFASFTMTRTLLSPEFIQRLERLTFHLKHRIRSSRRGEHRSRQRGSGGDFIDVRPYTTGDDLRHLDWHLLARLDTLFIRLYEAPREHTVHILFDTSASMGCGKSRTAQQLAAVITFVALKAQDRVNLFTFGDGRVEAFGPLRSKQSTHRLLSTLDKLMFQGTTNLEDGVKAFVNIGRQHGGTVILISDLLTPTEQIIRSLKLLASLRYRVTVLHTLSREERQPPVGQDLTLIDSETDATLEITLDATTLLAYLDALQTLTSTLHKTCDALGFRCLDIDCGDALEHIVLEQLLGTQLLNSPA